MLNILYRENIFLCETFFDVTYFEERDIYLLYYEIIIINYDLKKLIEKFMDTVSKIGQVKEENATLQVMSVKYSSTYFFVFFFLERRINLNLEHSIPSLHLCHFVRSLDLYHYFVSARSEMEPP